MLTILDFVIIYLIVIIGATLQGSIGMGFGLIVAPFYLISSLYTYSSDFREHICCKMKESTG